MLKEHADAVATRIINFTAGALVSAVIMLSATGDSEPPRVYDSDGF